MDIAEAQAVLPQYTFRSSMVPGAQGDVFRALDGSGRDVVVKIVTADQWMDRGVREVTALKRISHPSLLTLTDSGLVEYGGRRVPFMVTEFIEGQELKALLNASSFDAGQAPMLVSSISEGLVALWAERIVHRDVKPANIIVRPDGQGVLLDLGVARCLDMTTLTVGFGSPGTPGYLSPEQARGQRSLTVKSDIYALGVTAYEAIVGDHPFGRNQALMIAAQHAPAVPSGAPCTRTTADVISSMMEPRASMRPMPSDVIEALSSEV